MGLMVKCPTCSHAMWAAESAVGRKLMCKRCDHIFIVPAPSEEEYDDEPTLETAGVEDSGLHELDDLLVDLGDSGATPGGLPASDSSLINDLFSEESNDGTATATDFFEKIADGSGFIDDEPGEESSEKKTPSIADPNEDSGGLSDSRDQNLVFVDDEVQNAADALGSMDGGAGDSDSEPVVGMGELKFRPAAGAPDSPASPTPVFNDAPVFRLGQELPESEDSGLVAPAAAPALPPTPPPESTHNDPYATIKREDIILHVKRVKDGTVLIEFASQLLEIPAFRSSIPMRCLKSGESDPSKLIARPLAWIDRLRGEPTTAREFSDVYARQVPLGLDERQFVDSLFPIDQLPMPFNLQMPYYLSAAHDKSVEIPSRVIHTDYGVGCEILMPLSAVVMEWVGRVNGICGPEFVEMQRAVMVRQSQAWLALPDRVRQRLSGWFGWRPDERFLIFLPDSDFARADEGLAGLVLSSKRLVYCKYRAKGQHDLTKKATLIFEWQDSFCQLILEKDGERCEMVRLRRETVQALRLLLEGVQTEITFQEV
jgi:hypothetical protein